MFRVSEYMMAVIPWGARAPRMPQNVSALACFTCGSACTLASSVGRHGAVDLDQRDGVAARRVAAEMEGRDVDPGVAEQRARTCR